nr:MAG TPA: hypothetical protein [Caudoviricetes sp.]
MLSNAAPYVNTHCAHDRVKGWIKVAFLVRISSTTGRGSDGH